MINQISGNEELLNTARDYFHFVTKFFEPINVSATHIYHSALELSPLSSIIRKLYYHRRYTSSPRVIVGNQDSWDPWLTAPCKHGCTPCTWSPCGRFIAVGGGKGVEIRDSLSLELLSTLMPTEPVQEFMDQIAYSTDGCSIASIFGTSLIIWDIQTGGVAKEIEHESTENISLAWSLDGSTIGIISKDPETGPHTVSYTVYVYNIASGAMHSPGTLPSADKPYLWAHDASFRVMTTAQDDLGRIINISGVGSILTKIETSYTRLWWTNWRVGSFSQTTHRISIRVSNAYFVLDARTSRRLLRQGYPTPHCFSPDGSLFAGISESENAVHIWKYTSDGYTLWREFPLQLRELTGAIDYHSLQFSPSSSSLLARSEKFFQLLRLDGPPVAAHPDYRAPLVALSCCGSYIAACRRADSTVTITNLFSQTPHFVDTDMMIKSLALTGNVLLTLGSEGIAAWRLTEEGAVDGVFANRRAGRGDSIWTVPCPYPKFTVEDQTVTIKRAGTVIHAYHTGTGEVLEPVRTPPHNYRDYSFECMLHGLHYLRYRRLDPVSRTTIKRGWVKDPEGRHRIWIPVEWRNLDNARSFDDSKTLRLDPEGETILIRF